ncbi:VIT1/CCC1 transporter family protein [Stenoxybacter acetivorans]|uniref:VIT1/CCC1 transporter family protein n=1 Tax=Stenoxybacter acetivorans TaxID=422441 RepID=UPI00056D3AD9|nr:VIT family protein [Stenoxybacter acetivorans]
MSYSWHTEKHFSARNNWLRAAVLGANDGLISTASLLMGVSAAQVGTPTLLLTGAAALVSGALSMAAGEYVSVSSQADTEKADLAKEAHELARNPTLELAELTKIYELRGLNHELAAQVAAVLTQHNALEAHARDEIGITDTTAAKPFQAACASAVSFCSGAFLPVLVAVFSTASVLMPLLAISTLLGLSGLGYVSAKLGGAPVVPAMMRVVLWGAAALFISALIGRALGVPI